MPANELRSDDVVQQVRYQHSSTHVLIQWNQGQSIFITFGCIEISSGTLAFTFEKINWLL